MFNHIIIKKMNVTKRSRAYNENHFNSNKQNQLILFPFFIQEIAYIILGV